MSKACTNYCGWHVHYVGRGGIDLMFPMEKLLGNVRGYLARGVNGVKIKLGRAAGDGREPAHDARIPLRLRAVAAVVHPA